MAIQYHLHIIRRGPERRTDPARAGESNVALLAKNPFLRAQRAHPSTNLHFCPRKFLKITRIDNFTSIRPRRIRRQRGDPIRRFTIAMGPQIFTNVWGSFGAVKEPIRFTKCLAVFLLGNRH